MVTGHYQTIFHTNDADPPVTFWLIEVEGRNARVALKEKLDQVIASARGMCRDYFGADIFNRDELISQIHVISANGRWYAAEDL